MRRIAALLLAATIMAPAAEVAAVEVTKQDLPLLPEFCRHVQVISKNTELSYSPEAARWVAYMGNGFWAMHHYCWGLVRLMRADKAGMSATERKYWRETSVGEFDYVLENTGQDFVMRADVLAKRGDVLRQLARYREAAEAFREAIALRSNYEAAYYGLADTLWAQGDAAEALAVIDGAMAQMPDARFLPKLRQRIVASKKR